MTTTRERRTNKYKGWQIFRDKDGHWRCYHRKSRHKIDCVRFEPYSLSFDMEVHRINELQAEKQAKPGTLGMLITRYRDSVRFKTELALGRVPTTRTASTICRRSRTRHLTASIRR